jgi:hypothetical protein
MSKGRQKEIFEAARDDFSRRLAEPPPMKIPRLGRIEYPLDKEELKKAMKKYGIH